MSSAPTAADLRAMLPMVPVSSTKATHIGFDELPFVEVAPGVEVQVLHVDLKQGLWIVRNRFQPGAKIAKHYHTGPVLAVTLRGEWYYEEYPEERNSAGSYLFEPAASVHTLTIPKDQKGPTEVWFAIYGCNVDMNEKDEVLQIIDANTMLKGYRLLCEAAGKSTKAMIVVGE